MDIQNYVNEIMEIQNKILEYIDNYHLSDDYFHDLKEFLINHHFLQNRGNFKLILTLIKQIENNHRRTTNFFNKIEQLITILVPKVKKTFSNIEIMRIFFESKRILVLLFEQKILIIDEHFREKIWKEKHKFFSYYEYFGLEMDGFHIEDISELKPDLITFLEKRKIGENDEYFCQLIRKDSINEFIDFVNTNKIQIQNYIIEPSVFETNLLLIRNKTNLAEYAAFFGSIQIFKYLLLNQVKLTPSLWIYAIHSRNPEIIHLLEENNIEPHDKNYNGCLKESIKCHHNEIADYFINNFIDEKYLIFSKKEFGNNIFDDSFHYQNLYFLQDNIYQRFLFYYACKYNYFDIVNHFMKRLTSDINVKLDVHPMLFSEKLTPLRLAVIENSNEVVDLLITHPDIKFDEECFMNYKQLVKIKIPSIMTSIEACTFDKCSLLKEVIIPSSVSKIKEHAFYQCSSLETITIPSSVESIGSCAFYNCASLKKIEILSSNIIIDEFAFGKCHPDEIHLFIASSTSSTIKKSAFDEITSVILSDKMTQIPNNCFNYLESLKKIVIPSSVSIIGLAAFEGCKLLESISIPNSVNRIENRTFSRCSSLKSVSIPPSVTFIGENAFSFCTYLYEISIPDSVTSIGQYAFYKCSFLKKFTIPPLVTTIEKSTFQGCFSLRSVDVPSSLSIIKSEAFSGCISLENISIPSSIKLLGYDNFKCCPFKKHSDHKFNYFC